MRSTSGMTAVSAEHARLRRLTATLKENLGICAKDATVDAVHDVRTGTRRIEAMLDTIVRERVPESAQIETENIAVLHEASRSWMRLLKRIRRAAGAVRDLDVHRKLLEKKWLEKKNGDSEAAANAHAAAQEAAGSENGAAVNGTVKAGVGSPDTVAAYAVEQQAHDLDMWLKHARQHQAQPLMKGAEKWSGRLDDELALFEKAMGQVRRRRGVRSAAIVALEAFARLADQMQRLDEGNLHDFRKGAKKARYMAESGGEDPQAGAVGKALKKLQDEIGDWHDWLVLADEAHNALGANGAELTHLIEAERDRHYADAMETAERMRGRLLGELQALSQQRRTRTRSARVATSRAQIS